MEIENGDPDPGGEILEFFYDPQDALDLID